MRVTTDRRGFAGGSRRATPPGPWRTSGEWWATGPAGQAGRWGNCVTARAALMPAAGSRDEWDVALSDGGVYRIFQDRETDGWFIDAIVD